MLYSRTFTGAWIETCSPLAYMSKTVVAPSRVRGLKHLRPVFRDSEKQGRTFTGAWIETANKFKVYNTEAESHLHGCVD